MERLTGIKELIILDKIIRPVHMAAKEHEEYVEMKTNKLPHIAYKSLWGNFSKQHLTELFCLQAPSPVFFKLSFILRHAGSIPIGLIRNCHLGKGKIRFFASIMGLFDEVSSFGIFVKLIIVCNIGIISCCRLHQALS